MSTLASWLMDILVCPKCHSPLTSGAADLTCRNPECGLVYPITDGIPVLLVDEAIAPKA